MSGSYVYIDTASENSTALARSHPWLIPSLPIVLIFFNVALELGLLISLAVPLEPMSQCLSQLYPYVLTQAASSLTQG